MEKRQTQQGQYVGDGKDPKKEIVSDIAGFHWFPTLQEDVNEKPASIKEKVLSLLSFFGCCTDQQNNDDEQVLLKHDQQTHMPTPF